MCTISWQCSPGGVDLFFNRDELRTRSPALPVARRMHRNGMPYLAPYDPDGGGTWIFANGHGRVAALLNRMPPPPPAVSPSRSRGQLMNDLAGLAEDALFERTLHAAVRDHTYAPFRLGVFGNRAVEIHAWDGVCLRSEATGPRGMLTTSSIESSRIMALRREAFQRSLAYCGEDRASGLAEAARFHLSHEPNRGAESILMARDDARTVSLTRVHCVRGDHVEMVYQAVADTRPPQLEKPSVLRLRVKEGAPAHV
jgi:hypothetical protein